jgi:hypothetical protein
MRHVSNGKKLIQASGVVLPRKRPILNPVVDERMMMITTA